MLAGLLPGLRQVSKTCGDTDQWSCSRRCPRPAAAVSAATVTRRAGDASTARDRQVVEAVRRTGSDGFLQARDRPDKTTSKALRGGTNIDDRDDVSYWIDDDHYRFVSDVAITGRDRLRFSEGSEANPYVGTFAVGAGQGQSGDLTVTANIDTVRGGVVTVTGTIGGRAVRLTTTSCC